MKRTALAATAVAALLLLAGCSSTTTSETVTVTPGASGTFSEGDTTVVVEPPESPAPAAPVEVSTVPEAPTKATSVLTGMQLAVAAYGVDVAAEQVKSAANYACDQLAAGISQASIVALTGDVPERANSTLVQMAADEYCAVR